MNNRIEKENSRQQIMSNPANIKEENKKPPQANNEVESLVSNTSFQIDLERN